MTLNKTEEEQMLDDFYAAYPKFAGLIEMEKAGAIGHLDAIAARHGFTIWKSAIAHANSKHSAILEERERLAKLAEKQAEEIERLKRFELTSPSQELLKAQLSAANSSIAMKDEAADKLLHALALYHVGEPINELFVLGANLRQTISATPQQVSEWEEKKLEPLRKQVAMLLSVIGKIAPYIDGFVPEVQTAINDTQAAADAFKRDIELSVAERALEIVYKADDAGDAYSKIYNLCAELRATANRKDE